MLSGKLQATDIADARLGEKKICVTHQGKTGQRSESKKRHDMSPKLKIGPKEILTT